MSIVWKVSWGVNQRFNSCFVVSVYRPAFNMVTWTPFCLNVLGCLKCLCYNDHQMRKRLMVCAWINTHKHSISNVSFLRVISLNEFWKFLWLGNSAWNFIPGGGTPLYVLYGYVPLNRVWFSMFRVLNRVWNFTIERLELGVSLGFWVLVEALGMSYRIDFNLYRKDLVLKLPGNLTMCQQEKYRLSKQIISFFCFKFK